MEGLLYPWHSLLLSPISSLFVLAALSPLVHPELS